MSIARETTKTRLETKRATMKAIVQDAYGSADVLKFRDIEVPVVGDEDVLVRVHAAGCGPDVWHLMTGMPYMARPAIGFRKPKVGVRGWDVAGTVEEVGANVTGFQPGDEVMGISEGSFADLAIARPDKLVPKPANLTFEQAAAVPISGITALRAVHDVGKVQPGQKVLILGAAGGVGSLAVQIAKASGAEVTGVCSTSKEDLVRSIGADDVIEYTREDFTDGPRRWDVIIDTAGRRPLSLLRRALTPKGTLVIVGGDGGGRWTGGFFRGVLRAPVLSLFVGQRLRGLATKVKHKDLVAVSDLIEQGKVTPMIDRTYPLIEAPDAIRYLETGHTRGKVVVSMSQTL
jgi:NADPH:quinone reductase-like Zn-dependent oxidoreductase